MKKSVAMILVVSLLMLFSFCGCSVESEADGEQSGGSVITTTTASRKTTTIVTTNKPTTVTTTKVIVTKAPTTKKPTVKQPAVQVTAAEKHSVTVYITPTGKRYHLDSDCGGKNSSATTLERATGMGLTPCKKCAQ